MKIVLCGSMMFAKEMIQHGETLVSLGHEVVLPKNINQHADILFNAEENRDEKIAQDLIRGYFREIESSDGVLVINNEKNEVPNYIGANSLIEMAFAFVLRKPIFLLNPIPDLAYRSEIEAMFPIVVRGDMTRIKP